MNVEFEEQKEALKAFCPDKAEIRFSVTSEQGPYWVECLVEAPKALSLAPRSELDKGRVMLGIVASGQKLQKEVRIFSSSVTYPDKYGIKLTFLVYDKEATIADRIECTRELEFSDPNAKVL